MKLTFALCLALCIITQACNNSSPDSVDNAKDANKEKDSSSSGMHASDSSASTTTATMPVDKDAADFAVEAANGSMMEVEMGKLAETKASAERVKNFATMMVNDHSKAGEELKKLAGTKNITLPGMVGDDAGKHIADLGKKTGRDFDKAYMDMMLKDHKDDVSKFEKTAKDCKDPDLRNFASQTLPVLLKHLDSAKAIVGKR